MKNVIACTKSQSLFIALSLLMAASLACSLAGQNRPLASPPPKIETDTPAGLSLNLQPTATETAAVSAKTKAVGGTHTPPAPTLTATPANPLGNFPIVKGGQVDPPNMGFTGDLVSGSFKILTDGGWQETSQFYAQALPELGWSLRYTESNYQGGPRQAWKKIPVYLELNYRVKASGVEIQANYTLSDEAQGRALLPKGFPIPDGTDFTSTSRDSVSLTIPMEYDKAMSAIQGTLKGLGWKASIDIDSGGAGSCGGDCGGEPFPANVTPYPMPTPEKQAQRHMVWTTADGDEVTIDLYPHRGNTRISYSLAQKNPSVAGFPSDVPLYPGYSNVIVNPGMLSFTAPAGLETVVKFYMDGLKAAGWKESGSYSANTAEQYYQQWVKENLELIVIIIPSGGSASMVSIQCSACTKGK